MDVCSTFSLILGVWWFFAYVAPAIIKHQEEAAKARALKKAQDDDAKFQREHPEAWRAKEMVKLEKERLEAQKQLMQQREEEERGKRNVGAWVTMGRMMGWW